MKKEYLLAAYTILCWGTLPAVTKLAFADVSKYAGFVCEFLDSGNLFVSIFGDAGEDAVLEKNTGKRFVLFGYTGRFREFSVFCFLLCQFTAVAVRRCMCAKLSVANGSNGIYSVCPA
jgi:hypothetical protein